MTMWQVICIDILEWCKSYIGEPFHAILCDPPYALNFMNKAWDDNIAFQPETWVVLAEHLLPGGFIMAFGGTRTFHRLACAMEDAGLVINSALFLWAQGSGFPKSANIHVQLEKRLCYKKGDDWYYTEDDKPMRTEPPFRHSDADKFYGHRYGTQCLKPSVEPIICAQKPWEGKRLNCIVETGVGALWVDGGRISTTEDCGRPKGPDGICYGHYKQIVTEGHPQGRWPANFVLCHSEGCERVGVKRVKSESGGDSGRRNSDQFLGAIPSNDMTLEGRSYADSDGMETVDAWECVEECPARKLDEQAGERKSGALTRSETAKAEAGKHGIYGHFNGKPDGTHFPANKGGASRFFHQANWSHEIAERIANADPVRYCPKAARKERDAGLPGDQRSGHPTVKPISLCRWLATLLLPPSEYAPRRILVPFAGSGSEMIAAGLAGWEEIVGVEFMQDYCDIAEARLDHWLSKPRQLELP